MVKKYWFKRRRYGWGWFPVTWQGWAVLAAYLVVVAGASTMLNGAPPEERDRELGFVLLIVVLATAGLIRISFWKGPRPHWRWGRSPDDDPAEDA